MNAMRLSVAKLLEGVDTLVPASWAWRRYHQWSLFFPFASQLRRDIEFRIIGRYFARAHNRLPPLDPSLLRPLSRYFARAHSLPTEFNFANYVNRLFMHYLAELGEVSPVSWLLLAILVALNLFRAGILDPSAQQHGTCSNVPLEYYVHARDYHIFMNNTEANIVQPGEGTSSPPTRFLTHTPLPLLDPSPIHTTLPTLCNRGKVPHAPPLTRSFTRTPLP